MEAKSHNCRFLIILTICAIALGIGAGLFLLVSKTGHSDRYHLSDERVFGITNLDEVVETLRASLKQRSKEMTISFSFQGEYMDDISPFVKELMELTQEETNKADEGDYIRYQMGGYTFSYGHEEYGRGYRYSVIITPAYYSSASQEKETALKISEILDAMALPDNAGDYEKVRAVCDYLKQNVTYDAVHKKNEYHTVKSTAYGALIRRSASCQGICVAAYRLLKELGVDCRVITGTGIIGTKEEYHAWNIVCIDGLYYNLDITWDMQNDVEEYFLRCDENFPEHIPDEEFTWAEFLNNYPKSPRDYGIN